jgi:hypothetical protein
MQNGQRRITAARLSRICSRMPDEGVFFDSISLRHLQSADQLI